VGGQKCYEIKQYKKGLKAADAVLKKFPEHGETLAMKGLTLSCMGRKDEAYEFVRNGLKHDLRSHVCWHVYGLVYRFDRNYNEAIKCYRNALRLDPDNLQILRDLYLLQVQMRDLKGFAETRRTMLTLKPNNRNNWIGFAIAHHLVGNYQMAIDILEKYFSTLDANRKVDYEDSEICFYQNMLIEESGDIEKALAHLEASKPLMLDSLVWRQKKAEFLLRLERYDESVAVFDELLEINFDNYVVQRGMQCALMKRKDLFKPEDTRLPTMTVDFSKEPQGKELVELLRKYYASKKDTVDAKSTTCLRVPLDVVDGDEFKALVDELLRSQLTHGVPSLGSDIKTVYRKHENVEIIEALVLSYIATLEKKQPLLGEGAPKSSVLLWTLYFAAQHFDRIGKYDTAMQYIDRCIALAPTTLDFFQRKARIYKHMGDRHTAADIMEQARKLDLADRYINNKTTEYFLHADRVAEADATIALFTRHEGDPQQNLFDMQCMWYENAHGLSHVRQHKYGLALKRFFAVEKHFDDFIEDQFDFHTYCIRKMTLRAYLGMLRLCDDVYGHKFYVTAAHGAIQSYLAIAEEAERQAADANGDAAGGGTSAADKKKAKRAQAKARKAEFRKKEEEELKARLQKEAEEKEKEANKKKNSAPPRKDAVKDTDPFGEELAKKPPLEEAWRFVAKLQQYAKHDIRTHLAAFDVAVRKHKMLLCLQALLRGTKCLGKATEAQKKELETRRARFLEEIKTVTDPVVLKVINDKKAELTV
jgi:N-alpha-acetyltransferase 15/16, NatA auxiliary subunit